MTRRARSDIGEDAKWTLVPAAAAYIDVASFGKPAEAAAKVLTQGWLVAVSGRLEYAEWETADGAKRSGHQVIGHVEFLAAPKGAATRSTMQPRRSRSPRTTTSRSSHRDDRRRLV